MKCENARFFWRFRLFYVLFLLSGDISNNARMPVLMSIPVFLLYDYTMIFYHSYYDYKIIEMLKC